MADAFTLSLRLSAEGDRAVLAALDSIEHKARAVYATTTQAAQVLQKLGIGARRMGKDVVVAGGDVEKATQLLQKMGIAANVASREQRESARADAQASKIRTQGFSQYLAMLTEGARHQATRAESVRQLITLEGALTKQLNQTNLSLQQQVRISQALTSVQGGIAAGTEQQIVQQQRLNTGIQRSVAAITGKSRSLSVFGRELITNQGRLSAFSTKAIGGFNAAAFALSSFTASGTVSFRSLATAAAGFAAFFGPGGAIASVAIIGGLAITDFFTRARKEIEETRQKAIEAAADMDQRLESARRSRDPAALEGRIQDDTRELREKEIAAAAILHRTEEARTEDEKARLVVLQQRITELQKEIDINTRARLNPPAPLRSGGLSGVTVQGQKPPTTEELQKQQSARIAALTELHKLGLQTGADLVQLAAFERALALEVSKGNVTLERRAQIEKDRAAIRAASLQAPAIRDITDAAGARRPPIDVPGLGPVPVRLPGDTPNRRQARDGALLPGERPTPGRNGSALQLEVPVIPVLDMSEARKRMQDAFDAGALSDLQQTLAASLAGVITSGITQGFAQGLAEGGWGEGFKQMALSIASGFGSLFVQIGQQAIAGSVLVEKIVAAISTMNPAAAIIAATALIALGSSLSGRGRGGGGAGGFSGSVRGGGSSLSVSRLVVDPNARVGTGPRLAPIGANGMAAPENPFEGMKFLVVNTPGGRSYLTTELGKTNTRGYP